MLITAVDAETGEPVVFDRHSGVDLVDAVAASCSSGLPYRIGDGRYIDGGYRSNADNADLAAGSARVLVLSPFGGRTRTPMAWGMHLATQVDELRAHGSSVETSSRTKTPSTCSAPTRWIPRCVRPRPRLATTRAESPPSSSPTSGADAASRFAAASARWPAKSSLRLRDVPMILPPVGRPWFDDHASKERP